jgi:vacuolar-type H+-ATPase subunit E/Vma4
MGMSSPKPDPAVEEARRAAEAKAKNEEATALAREQERRRSAALGFRGRGSLISASTSAGFAPQQSTLGG